MTQSFSVRCQNCGAPLQIEEGLRYITCAHCGSELEIVRDASTVHTQVLQQIQQNTAMTVNQLKVIEIQNDLERLDRDWEAWKESNLTRGKDGSPDLPGEPVSVKAIAIIFLVLMGIVGALLLITSVFEPIAWILLVLVGLILFVLSIAGNANARIYHNALARYERQRDAYLIALNAARRT